MVQSKVASRSHSTPEQKREYRKRKKLERELSLAASGGDGEWYELKERIRKALDRTGLKPSMLAIYKDILKIERQSKASNQITADEIAKRNLEAERQLKEGGYIG